MKGSTSNEVLTMEDELGWTKTGRSHGLLSVTALEYTRAGRDEYHVQKPVRMDMDHCFRSPVL